MKQKSIKNTWSVEMTSPLRHKYRPTLLFAEEERIMSFKEKQETYQFVLMKALKLELKVNLTQMVLNSMQKVMILMKNMR